MQISNIIHVGKIKGNRGQKDYLYLLKSGDNFTWESTEITSKTIEEALKCAESQFRLQEFDLLKCGFLYTLPERDEHGQNATFEEMNLSYASPSGIFFHPKLGHNCFVQGASNEALSLWRNLKDDR